MLLPLIPLAGLSFLAFKVFRVRRRARPFMQLSRGERIEFAKLVVREPSLPFLPRLLVGAAAAYLALPIDVIPDFIPVVGHADDFVVVTLLMAVMTRVLPAGTFEGLVRRAQALTPQPPPPTLRERGS